MVEKNSVNKKNLETLENKMINEMDDQKQIDLMLTKKK